MPKTSRSGSLLKRMLALVVLLIAGFVLFKIFVGVIAGIFFAVMVVVALVAVAWAYSTLKRR